MRPTILFLFNSSHYAVQPWLDDGGFECVSVDWGDSDHSGAHRPTHEHARHHRMNIDLAGYNFPSMAVRIGLRKLGLAQPSFILSFAPCTDMAVCGAKHFKSKALADPQFQDKAVSLARLVEQFDCPSIVENPVSVLATMWKKPTGYVHPWHFMYDCPSGNHPEFPEVIPARDMYNKKTGLWCQNGAAMPKRNWWVPPIASAFPGWAQLGGKSARTKYIRSLTPRGLAKAIYLANRDDILSQWGTQDTTVHAIMH